LYEAKAHNGYESGNLNQIFRACGSISCMSTLWRPKKYFKLVDKKDAVSKYEAFVRPNLHFLGVGGSIDNLEDS